MRRGTICSSTARANCARELRGTREADGWRDSGNGVFGIEGSEINNTSKNILVVLYQVEVHGFVVGSVPKRMDLEETEEH